MFQRGFGAIGWNVLPAFLGLWAIAAVSGCGRGDYPLAPVTGAVTYEDGSIIPAEEIRLTFIPQAAALDSKTHPRPGSALVNVKDGTIGRVTTHKPGDGVIVGECKVVVKALGPNETATDAVRAEYTDVSTTPLKVTIARGMGPLTLKIKKPQ